MKSQECKYCIQPCMNARILPCVLCSLSPWRLGFHYPSTVYDSDTEPIVTSLSGDLPCEALLGRSTAFEPEQRYVTQGSSESAKYTGIDKLIKARVATKAQPRRTQEHRKHSQAGDWINEIARE